MSRFVTPPDDATLRRFLLGELPADDAEGVRQYLEEHPVDPTTLEALAKDDTFIEHLRECSRAAAAPSPILSDLMTRLERLPRAKPAVQPNEETFPPRQPALSNLEVTGDVTSPTAEKADADALDFLAPPAAPDELGRLGAYRVVRILGSGGMGMVFEARDAQLDRRVALKVMRPDVARNATAKDRFLREAKAAAAIEDDHIIPIFQVGEANGVPFLAMPMLKGESLDHYIKTKGVLPVPDVLRIGREIALGLAAAHERGLIHRDIKPANIWLEAQPARVGGQSRVKILDFGLARSSNPEQEQGEMQLTQSGTIVGTPSYMAPEQARGLKVDGRTDLFSLGVVLYRMATAQLPFKGNDTVSQILALATDTPTHPTLINPDLPDGLSDLIMRLLDKVPASRPASAHVVAEALADLETAAGTSPRGRSFVAAAAATSDTTSSLARPAAKTPARRAEKKRRGPITAVVAALLLLAGGAFALYEFVIKTPNGTMVVQIDDKEVETRFKNGELQILDKGGAVKYTLKPGERSKDMPPGTYRVHVVGADGLTVDTDEFTLKNGEKYTVRVKMLPVGLAKIEPAKEEPKVVGKQPEPGTPLKDREKPFVLTRGGKDVRPFASLQGALNELQSGDIVEIHGNGPFKVPSAEIKRDLTLRAAAGFRPRFLPADDFFVDNGANTWLNLQDAALTIEGCDFIARSPDAKRPNISFIRGSGPGCSLRNCRVVGFHTLFDHIKTPTVEMEDCLAVSGLLGFYHPKTKIAFRNNLIGCYANRLEAPGGQAFDFQNNTVHVAGGAHGDGLIFQDNGNTKDITVAASGNIFDSSPSVYGVFMPVYTNVAQWDWRPQISWQGKQNLYCGLGGSSPKGWPGGRGLAAWNKYLPRPEEGSLEATVPIRYLLRQPFLGDFADLQRLALEKVAGARQQSGIADLGPDFTLLGPGDAYVHALEAAGGKLPKDQLRPEAQPGGPVVLVRGGRAVRGFTTIALAIAQAHDGDTIELRGDRTFESCDTSADRGALTLRAGPGYRPILVGPCRVGPGTTLALEGLHFRNGDVTTYSREPDKFTTKQGRISRVANCSFEKGRINGLLERADGKPGEIVNCLLPERISLIMLTAAPTEIRQCVLAGIDPSTRPGGKTAIHFDRCLVWTIHELSSFVQIFDGNPKTEYALQARRTLFDVSSSLVYNQPAAIVRWQGDHNFYSMFWKYGVPGPATSLAGWRQHTGSAEEGSVEGDATLWDPRQWRLLPGSAGYQAGPGGKDLGADVSRVARPALDKVIPSVPVEPKLASTALDKLDPAKIPADERFPGQPKELVAVLGENRGGHFHPIGTVAFHPDGKLAASVGQAEGVRLWDTATMRLRQFLPGSGGFFGGKIAISPDGKLLAGTNGKLLLWDLTAPEPKPLPPIPEKSFHFTLFAFVPDSQRILGGGRGGLELWDVKTGKQVRRFEGQKGVSWLTLSPDGHRALSAGVDSSNHWDVRLWDVDSGKELYRKPAPDFEHTRLAFSPEGKRFVVGSFRIPAKIFEVESGEQLGVFPRCMPAAAVFTRDGKRIVFAANDPEKGYLAELDVATGAIRRFETNDDLNVDSIALSPDGASLLTNGAGKAPRLWDLKTRKELLPRKGHTGPVVGCGFLADGKKLVSVSTDLTVRVWDLTGSAPLEQSSTRMADRGTTPLNAAVSPDGRRLAIGTAPRKVELWDLDGQPKLRTRLLTPAGSPIKVAFRADGALVVLVNAGGPLTLNIWDVSAQEPKAIAPIKVTDTSPAFSPDAKTVAIPHGDGNVELLDLTVNPPKVRLVFKAHKNSARAVAFSPDGKTLATCGREAGLATADDILAVKLWDMSGDKPVRKADLLGKKWDEPHGRVPSLAFSPDGKMVVAHATMGWNIVWDVASHKQLRAWHLPGSGPMLFAPDNRHLVTGLDGGALFILRLEAGPALLPANDDAWLKRVAALPAVKQVQAVAEKLKELNPGFDGREGHEIRDGVISELHFDTDEVSDISPLRALTGLKELQCVGRQKGQLADLAPLKGLTKLTKLVVFHNPIADLSPLKDMRLTHLNCESTRISDLAPLKDMKLSYLNCVYTEIEDLSPLKDMKLTELWVGATKVADSSPLKGMPLTKLDIRRTRISDLSVVKGMKLEKLLCSETGVSNLSPLHGMELAELDCFSARVTDLAPLTGMPLKIIRCDFKAERDAPILRLIKTLDTIDGKPAAEFWKEVDAKKP